MLAAGRRFYLTCILTIAVMHPAMAPASMLGAQAGAAVFDAPSWVHFDPPVPRNRVTFTAGGIMTTPRNLSVDLDTGRFWFKQGLLPMDKGHEISREGVLDQTVVSSLRQRAKAALADAMTTPECKAEKTSNRPPPTLDAIIDLSVWLDGAAASAPPSGQCWSASANALQSAALAAVDPPSKRLP